MKKFLLSLDFKSGIKFLIILIFSSTFCFASDTDTLFVRLKSGAKLKGKIITKTQDYFIINSIEAGEQKINWDEITLLTSSDVYDSLKGNNSILVLPPPKIIEKDWTDILSAEFLFGKGFKYNRFIGMGFRANIKLLNFITIGGIAVFHLGTDVNISPNGYGQLFYWGPEVGIRVNYKYLTFETSISVGEGTYQIKKDLRPYLNEYINSALESKLYYSPGVGLKVEYGKVKLGFQYKFIIINNMESPGLYISISN